MNSENNPFNLSSPASSGAVKQERIQEKTDGASLTGTIVLRYWGNIGGMGASLALMKATIEMVGAFPQCVFRIVVDTVANGVVGLGVLSAGRPVQIINLMPRRDEDWQPASLFYTDELDPMVQADILIRHGMYDKATLDMVSQLGGLIVFPAETQRIIARLIALDGLEEWSMVKASSVVFIKGTQDEVVDENSDQFSRMAQAQQIPVYSHRCSLD